MGAWPNPATQERSPAPLLRAQAVEMGLAQVLKKRKLGGGATSAQKRACQQNGGGAAGAPPEDPAEALRRQLANGGFADLVSSHQSKHTRTALRKQRKAEAAAKAAAEAAARAAEAEAERRQQRRVAGEASDSDGEDGIAAAAAANAAGHGGADGEEEEQAAAGYTRLLGSLGSRGGAFADALQQRQREQAGDSDASSDNDEEEEEEEGEEEELGSGSELGSEEEEEEEGEDELAVGTSDEEEAGSGSGEEDHEAAAEAADGEANGHVDSSEGKEEEVDDAQRRSLAANGTAEAAAAASAPAVEDHYLEHFDRELPEEQAAALLDGSSQRTRYQDCCASGGSKGGEQGPAVAPDVLQQWPDAALQAAEGTRLPQSAPGDLAAYGVKERLLARWREVAGPSAAAAAAGGAAAGAGGGKQEAGAAAAAGPDGDFASAQQRALFALLSCYSDLLLPCRPYPTAADAPDPVLDAVLLHALSHCAKAADRIKKNNDRLRAAAEKGAPPLDAVPKDQGFTRAKVLLLLPQRNLALRCVSRLLALAVRETRTDTIQNKQRFLEEFGDQGDELTERERAAVARKPAEHRALFGGNMDDHFRMGIKLTRGAVKLFADFYDSDIVVASPLALATKLAEGEEGAADFLSSIEILVADRADVMLMQNWAHVVTVFEALNQIPKDGHGVDMMRVRDWALSGRGALYRQTVLLSSFASAEMNALLARTCRNAAGKARLKPTHRGVLSRVIPQARQVFERLPAAAADGGAAPTSDADARFEHFKRVLWPRIKESGRPGGHLIYIPSYFDYVRVRNYLRQEMASFLGLCEYTERADAARARSYFFDRRKRVLLYTERAQFYNRHRIRGAQDILFYQLPEHADFYAELLNLLEEGGTGETPTVTAVFSKYDALRLERVVGSARSAKMLKQHKTGTFLFC
ncbi:hypothetical protein ABPG75_009908 [Micractinium tetrahymenae]